MPMRKLVDGTYLVKPPNNNICMIYSVPGGAVLWTGRPGSTPITLSVAVTATHVARLAIVA